MLFNSEYLDIHIRYVHSIACITNDNESYERKQEWMEKWFWTKLASLAEKSPLAK